MTEASWLDFEVDFGGIPNDKTPSVLRHNTRTLSSALQNNASSRLLYIPANKTFYLIHGVRAENLTNAIIQIDGIIKFERDFDENIYDTAVQAPAHDRPTPCILLQDARNVTLTSSYRRGGSSGHNNPGGGIIHGGGPAWWGIPFIGYLELVENRPVLFQSNHSSDILVEHLLFIDPPLYTMEFDNVNGLEIRHVSIVSRRTRSESHRLLDLSAFNTDGIDVSGHNVWIHDCDIWSQDDVISVKGNGYGDRVSSNMLFERINGTGLGFVIGSIRDSAVRNITFRDSYLHKSIKGIYMKFRRNDNYEGGVIENITYENITMESPQQFAIWIGPAQQADSRNLCAANPCSLCWPYVPFAQCDPVERGRFRNIVLRNVLINNPLGSPGVLMMNEGAGLVFDNVRTARGAPLAPATDIHATFPGLLRAEDNIQDIYVVRGFFVLLAVLVGIGCVLVLCFLACKMVCGASKQYERVQHQEAGSETNESEDSRRRTWSEEKKRRTTLAQKGARQRGMVVCCCGCGAVSVCVALLSLWLAHVWYAASNVNNYLICEGVTSGVALGETWPVPSCLDDHATGFALRQQPKTWTGIQIALMLVAFISLPVAVATLLLLRRFRLIVRTQSNVNRMAKARSIFFEVDEGEDAISFNIDKPSRVIELA